MRAGLGENVIGQDRETEVKVRWSGPRHTLPRLHQGDGENGAVIITKSKHQHALGMAYVPHMMLCYLHVLFYLILTVTLSG